MAISPFKLQSIINRVALLSPVAIFVQAVSSKNKVSSFSRVSFSFQQHLNNITTSIDYIIFNFNFIHHSFILPSCSNQSIDKQRRRLTTTTSWRRRSHLAASAAATIDSASRTCLMTILVLKQ
jgi:hypothetical protein